MINKKYLKLLRSNKRFKQNSFIYKLIAKRITDSLDLLKLDIFNALEIGINENDIFKYLNENFKNVNIERTDVCSSKSNIYNNINNTKF